MGDVQFQLEPRVLALDSGSNLYCKKTRKKVFLFCHEVEKIKFGIIDNFLFVSDIKGRKM